MQDALQLLVDTPIVNTEQAVAFVHSAYQFGSKLGLENMQGLLAEMGNPHLGLRYIHVAGTNGKGSTCAFLSQVLIEAGYKVGTYVSPFLEYFNERIQINRHSISDEQLVVHAESVRLATLNRVSAGQAHPTEFEIVTAIGFSYFNAMGVDIVVLEVGLGGRLDATNVIPMPLASVITPIGFDHMQYLGNTIGEIAKEKAGIIKGGLVISAAQASEAGDVISNKAQETEAKLIWSHHDRVDQRLYLADKTHFVYRELTFTMQLLGSYQVQNACTAIDTLMTLRDEGKVSFADCDLVRGIASAQWAGRFEKIHENPPVYLDGAHNVHGITAFKESMLHYHGDKRRIAVFGMLKDKDPELVLGMIAQSFETIYTVVPDNPRALTHLELHEILDHIGYSGRRERIENLELIPHIVNTYKDQDLILYCFGSLYYIGEVRKLLVKKH